MADDHNNERHVGAIAFYPTVTYCAHTIMNGPQFVGPIAQEDFPSQTPDEAFHKAIGFFQKVPKLSGKKLAGLGISLYGIVDIEKSTFLGTMQTGWDKEFGVLALLEKHGVASILADNNLACQTDAAAAAIAEYIWGAGKPSPEIDIRRKNLVYFKILDGIGSGVILSGRSWAGSLHPEMGHIPVRRHKNDTYVGGCPEHNDCVEGLASYAAMTERLASYGLTSLNELDELRDSNHRAWDIEAYYLAQLAVTATMVVAPRRIVFEGDVIRRHLLRRIRTWFKKIILDYPKYRPETKITSAAFFGHDASLLGALELGRRQVLKISDQDTERTVRLITAPDYPLGETLISGAEFEKEIEHLKAAKNEHDPTQIAAPTYSANIRRIQNAKIFGLSITESVEWAVASAEEGRIIFDTLQRGTLPNIPTGNLPHKEGDTLVIQDRIRDGLKQLYDEKPDVFRDISGIGVSTIGIVDHDKRFLSSLVRKPWEARRKGDPVINFPALFLGSSLRFLGEDSSCALKRDDIVVRNDATARVLFEYIYGFDGKKPDSVFYIMVGEGVNGALILEGDPLDMLGHTELGHGRPNLHALDVARVDRHEIPSGCPGHYQCFEGIASSTRFRLEYNRELWEIPPDDPAYDIEAFYLAQLAMNGVLMFGPQKIVFGGAVFYKNTHSGQILLEKVRSQFLKLNADYLPRYRTMDAVRELIGPSAFGEITKPLSALTVGCLAAFRKDRLGQALTAAELCKRGDIHLKRERERQSYD